MADRIDAVLDHVAIAVPDWRAAERRWRHTLGGTRSSAGRNRVFDSRQLRFANGAKLELLSPSPDDPSPDNFVRRFIDRFGTAVHHVTLKVPDLLGALDVVGNAGLEPVDVDAGNDHWKEAFLRPSQIGGMVVQLAQTPYDDDAWAELTGFRREPPRDGAARLLGPLLRHPDLSHATRLWHTLGATVAQDGVALRCSWPDSPLDVVIVEDAPAGPVALRMDGSGDLPADAGVGPPVVEALSTPRGAGGTG